MARKGGKFIQAATEKMRAKGTLGSYGKATAKKTARDIKKGGKIGKKALFARNMAMIARRRKRGGRRAASR